MPFLTIQSLRFQANSLRANITIPGIVELSNNISLFLVQYPGSHISVVSNLKSSINDLSLAQKSLNAQKVQDAQDNVDRVINFLVFSEQVSDSGGFIWDPTIPS